MHAPAHNPLFPRRRTYRGQTLIVAIAILFVLIFIGGIFVAQVGRNLTTSGRSRQIQQATELAEGGIKYCDEQLNSSEEGADWRPDPAVLLTSPNDTQGLRDPDYVWIIKGFHRIQSKGGRALVRVVYDPNPADPRGHYLKIESVGRPGELNPEDPTDFVPAGTASRLRKEMIAYKQIALTDFLRFVTQRTKNSTEAVFGGGQFGVPISLVMGEPEIGNEANANQRAASGVFNGNLLFGAPIHVNGNLKIVGDARFYLGKRGQPGDSATERINVTGNIIAEPTVANTQQAFLNAAINTLPNAANAIISTGAGFTTLAGRVRDGSLASDANGFSRGTMTINPPVLSNPIAGGTQGRYAWMTANSGVLGGTAANPYNTGRGGYGNRIYINNPGDRQEESSEIGNALSLRAEWLRSKDDAFSNGNWQGPFYRPPGITVELFGNSIRLTRSDNNVFALPDGTRLTQQDGKILDIPLSDFARRNYVLPNGTAFPLEPFPHDGDESESNTNPPNPPGYSQQFQDRNSYGVNVVLYAEGNVRVKGAFGAITNAGETSESAMISKLGRVHLTVVSGGTAYIEGNLVKGDGSVLNGTPTLERGSTCAVMARDYICVNTTAFMSPTNQSQAWNTLTLNTNYFFAQVGIGIATTVADMSSSFGIDPANYDTPTFLFLRHTAAGATSLMNLLINPAFAPIANPDAPLYLFNDPGLTGPLFAHVRALGVKYNTNGNIFDNDTTSRAPNFEQRAYPLSNGGANPAGQQYQLSRLPGLANLFRFRFDQTSVTNLAGTNTNIDTSSITDYYLGGAFVAPLDIRIEAMLYAQDRSFFIIPGYPVNPEPDDIPANAGQNGERKVVQGDTAQDIELKKLYPFYNQPADIRITIEGAISENYTASLADQTQWMSRWGWIPGRFGSSNQNIPGIHLRVQDPLTINPAQTANFDYRTPQESAANVTRGLRYLYDPALAMPYTTPRAANLAGDTPGLREERQRRALRAKTVRVGTTLQNPNGGTPVRQILPPTPRLPVCPDLLFMGDSDRRLEQD